MGPTLGVGVFETKKSRAWVIGGVVIALAAVSTVVSSLGDRAMDDQRTDFVVAAEDRLEDIDPDEAAQLTADQAAGDWVGRPSELDDLLVIGGREPGVVAFLRDGFEARYRLEAWGRTESVVVRVDADGLSVVTE